jgi:hypothetical protein
MAFNLADYETVESRLEKFWKEFPDGRVSTELEVCETHRYVVKAYLYRTYLDQVAYSTGFAEEKDSDRGVNATSALENCETSAIGRALANAGFATKGRRPSREEMVKVSVAGRSGSEQPDRPILKEKYPEPVKDAWTIENPKDVQEVVQVEGAPSLIEAINLLTDEMNAKEVPQAPKCQHGLMIHKTGVSSKTGKPYEGYTCSHKNRAEQCPPIWL